MNICVMNYICLFLHPSLDVVGNVHPPPLFCLLIDAKCITHKMPCDSFFPLLTPPCFGWAYLTQILIFLNVVNCNRCTHIRAIIFISTSNSGDQTHEFQRPLSHYVFRHMLVYPKDVFITYLLRTQKLGS